MSRKIVVILGHPNPGASFCRALAAAYAQGAIDAGHEVRQVDTAALEFPVLRTADEFRKEPPPAAILAAQEAISWAEHLVLVYPLWHGTMPALLKGFIEQCFRPGFALDYGAGNGWPRALLKGRSARVVVTMGMPALAYRFFYGSHSLKSLERNILKFCGIKPVRETLIGMVDALPEVKRRHWIERLAALGAKAL